MHFPLSFYCTTLSELLFLPTAAGFGCQLQRQLLHRHTPSLTRSVSVSHIRSKGSPDEASLPGTE
jgi:hypothetical protein